MRKLLNTLFITEEKSYLSAENSNIVLSIDGVEIVQIPVHIIENIICFSYVGVSPALIKLCGENNVIINYVSPFGKYLGTFHGIKHGNINVRKEQYRMSDNEEISLNISKNIILAKCINQKNVLERFCRDNKEIDLSKEKQNLIFELQKIDKCKNSQELLGIEGNVAKIYFSCFNNFIKQQKNDFIFTDRSKYPPRDMVNSLLSFFYSILTSEYMSAIECVGLDSFSGFFHKDKPGRLSLACDLMEELRAPLVDRFVLSEINNKVVKVNDFDIDISGVPRLKKDSMKRLLNDWQVRKKEEIMHPFLNEKIEIGLIPYCQAMLLSRYIRKINDDYPPFLWR